MESRKFLDEAQVKLGNHKSIEILIEALAMAYGRNLDVISADEKAIKDAIQDDALSQKCIEEAKARSKKYRREKYIGQWSANW